MKFYLKKIKNDKFFIIKKKLRKVTTTSMSKLLIEAITKTN